ncbi:MAG TPA: DUF4402 domain-containing protein [Prolixibacteraceae bacterium]|nr:DUF4402 domain-containing protein [Prolixibacteraceae bacterium]
MKKLLLFAIVILGFSAASFGQIQTILEDNNASATIIETLSIASTGGEDLNFGTIGSPKNASVVSITPAGVRGGTADLVNIDEGSTPTFTITGQDDAVVTVTLPGTIQLILTGSDPMNVDTWTSTISALNNVILDGGSYEFQIGATLHVNAEQDAGEYTGEYDIIVAYN